MIFNSFSFLIFFIIFLILYWTLNLKLRLILIFFSSLLFYGFWRIDFIPLLLFSVLVDFFASKKIYQTKQKKTKKKYLILSLFINLGILIFFKYFYFLHESTSQLLSLVGVNVMPIEYKILLPIGISFYTFQSISYTIDVYRNNIKPEKNLLIFANYVIFFPQLVAGPILRASEILWQFKEKRKFKLENFNNGIQRIIFGLFLKIVLADNIAKFVDQGFLMDPKLISAIDVITLSYLFGFQIYFDFAGYSHIAIGCALTMGIKFRENFNFPYHSISPKIFWKNWHISLSSWVRDYIYLPLLNIKSVNSSGGGFDKYLDHQSLRLYTIFILFITWSLMGLWHGASWNFVFWGIWNFLVIVLFRFINNFLMNNSFLKNIISWSISINLIMLGWVFFRSENLDLSFQMITNLLFIKNWTFLSLRENTYIVAFIVTFFYLISPLIIKIFKFISKKYKLMADFILLISIVSSLILILIYNQEVNQFIYFQF
tara:strand:+ start:831 stop:2288 length:1458 start_codon:yes stop_codon:yes gene_type:complete